MFIIIIIIILWTDSFERSFLLFRWDFLLSYAEKVFLQNVLVKLSIGHLTNIFGDFKRKEFLWNRQSIFFKSISRIILLNVFHAILTTTSSKYLAEFFSVRFGFSSFQHFHDDRSTFPFTFSFYIFTMSTFKFFLHFSFFPLFCLWCPLARILR